MKIDPVHYYYRDPITSVEMDFTRSEEYGWGVSFTNIPVDKALDYRDNIPWPTLTEAQKKVVDDNYRELYRILEEEDD